LEIGISNNAINATLNITAKRVCPFLLNFLSTKIKNMYIC